MTTSPAPMVDSYGTPNYPALRAAGVRLAGRYLAGGNPLTAGEAARAHAADVGLLLICERGATAALGGPGAGAVSGALYARLAAELGAAAGVCLWRTVDFDPTAVELARVAGYVASFSTMVRQRRYLAGAYGGTATVEAVRADVDLVWQAAGWSNGVNVAAEIHQLIAQETIAGVVLDEDLVGAGDVGAWMPKTAGVYGSTAPPPPSSASRKGARMGSVIVTDPNDGGRVVVNLANGTWRGVPNPAVEAWLIGQGVPVDNTPVPADVFAAMHPIAGGW